ncbi:MAG: magnesium transporter [Desulfurococcales archaeon]|nr:magnesium transporter [Desulfurococcales archaeon]
MPRRLLRRPTLRAFELRGAAQVAGGLAVANLGDVFNILLLAYFTPFLTGHPEALALLPNLAAMRGAIITSMASRVSTSLHLGTVEPSTRRVLARELLGLVALAMATSLYAAFLVALLSGYSFPLEETIAVISGIIAILFLAPFAAYIATMGYQRGLDPDRYMAPVLTVVGDISTAPTIVGVAVLIEHYSVPRIVFLSIVLAYTTVTITAAYLLRVRRARRILLESLAALLVVGVFESYAGDFLVGYSHTLLALGVMHAVPSIMEDVGAAASVAASKLSTLSHLYGFTSSAKYLPSVVAEVVLGSTTGFLILSLIAFLTEGLAGSHAPFLTVLTVVFLGGLLGTLVFSLVGYLLVGGSIYLNADPDNVVIPLLTSIVDASTIPLLVLVAWTVA